MNRTAVPGSATRRRAVNSRATSGPGSDGGGLVEHEQRRDRRRCVERPGEADGRALGLGQLADRTPYGSIVVAERVERARLARARLARRWMRRQARAIAAGPTGSCRRRSSLDEAEVLMDEAQAEPRRAAVAEPRAKGTPGDLGDAPASGSW